MGWGATLGVGFLTAMIAAAAAGWVTYSCTVWFRMRDAQEAVVTTLLLILLGFVVGLIIGIVTSRMLGGGFARALGWSAAIVLVIAGAAALVGRLNSEVAPTIDGEGLYLEVELKCPAGWTPDNRTRAGKNGLSIWPRNLEIYGSVQWQDARQGDDGRWVVPGYIDLFCSRVKRFARFSLGGKTDVVFWIPLPAHPTAKDEEWTPWKPANEYDFRVRVQRDSVFNENHMNAKAAEEEARKKIVDSLLPTDPLERWLELFDPDSMEPGDIGQARVRALEVVKTKMAEFPAALRSPDRKLVSRALKALRLIDSTPPELIPALGVAGHQVVNFIHAARASSQPGDPDLLAEKAALDFFLSWDLVMGHIGPNANAARLPVLQEIAADVKDEKDEDLAQIAGYVRQDIDQLQHSGAAPQTP
jgi:hypothetical protein